MSVSPHPGLDYYFSSLLFFSLTVLNTEMQATEDSVHSKSAVLLWKTSFVLLDITKLMKINCELHVITH